MKTRINVTHGMFYGYLCRRITGELKSVIQWDKNCGTQQDLVIRTILPSLRKSDIQISSKKKGLKESVGISEYVKKQTL